jgi:hypothetical protein
MKITVKSRLDRPSAAVAAAALLAFWFTFGGSQSARAEDLETLSPPAQDMILVSVKTVNELERRIIYLEETVEALTESWQHIETHRLCVSDDGGAQTCITKPQLDFILTKLAIAEISQPSVSKEAQASAPAEPVEVAVTTETVLPSEPSTEPTTVVGENVPPDQDSVTTGTVTSASSGSSTGAALLSYPKVEIYEDPVARSDD